MIRAGLSTHRARIAAGGSIGQTIKKRNERSLPAPTEAYYGILIQTPHWTFVNFYEIL